MDPQARQEPWGDGGQGGRGPVPAGVVVRDSQNQITGFFSQGALYIASPDLLRYLGIDADAMSPGADVLTALGSEPRVLLDAAATGSQGEEPRRWPPRRSPARPPPRCPPNCSIRPRPSGADGRRCARARGLADRGGPAVADQTDRGGPRAGPGQLALPRRALLLYGAARAAGAVRAAGHGRGASSTGRAARAATIPASPSSPRPACSGAGHGISCGCRASQGPRTPTRARDSATFSNRHGSAPRRRSGTDRPWWHCQPGTPLMRLETV
jgi:hypothetical protein